MTPNPAPNQPSSDAPLALDPVSALLFAPGRLVPRLRFDDVGSRVAAARYGLACLAIILGVAAFLGGPSRVAVREGVVLLYCVWGIFTFPFLRALAWRSVRLGRFAQVYAYVLPLGVAQMGLYVWATEATMGPAPLSASLVPAAWGAVALTVLLRRALAVAWWRSLVAIALGAAVQVAALVLLLLATAEGRLW